MGLVALTTACGPGGSTTTTPSSSSATSSTASSPAAVVPGEKPVGGPATCTSVEVIPGVMGPVDMPAPERTFATVPLALRNTGSVECTLFGFPGVSFTGEDGRTFDAPRSEVPHSAVVLAPGATAHATLRVHLGDNGTGWHVRSVSVTPPNTDQTQRFEWKWGPLEAYSQVISAETVVLPVTAG
ncbi:DUF4232 domain-containing protein [Lentzea aerocolonigenes]|uniref:DUF4232 domain-containing protein n=1 Tax=Lentzea aerocolonigenes TaxID=68170 RepID=UPI0018C8834B|nr:DUF4232 domain-containing protein [Lentzea aerocolonigenes]